MPAFLVVLLGITLARAIELGDPSGLHFNVNSEYAHNYENYKPRDYQFEYGVSDPHTGDHKTHWEVRENGVVRGEYSLLEPDGTTRVVQYTADDHGFRAVVKKIGHPIHPETYHSHTPEIQTPAIISNEHNLEPYYKSYDGAPENYIHLINDQSPIYSTGLNDHIEIQAPETHILGAEIPSLDFHGAILSEAPKTEYTYQSEPILSHHETFIEAPKTEIIHHQEPILTLPIQEHKILEHPSTIGVQIEHPHGESSSSFIGTTGNLDDDSAYTSYAKGTPSLGWEILGSKIDSLGLKGYEAPIPYQYLSKRSVPKDEKKKSK